MKVTPTIVYDPAGVCIYCGKESALSREHIIPFALGGTMIIPKASCSTCATETGRVEQRMMRDTLGNLRIKMGFPTRRKKERPTNILMRIKSGTDGYKTKSIPVAEYPRVLCLFDLPIPSFVSGAKWTNTWEAKPVIVVHSADLALLNAHSWEIARYDHATFCRMLAKIAHANAIGKFGASRFSDWVLPLPGLILGQDKRYSHFVGGSGVEQAKATAPEGKQMLHRIETKAHSLGGNEYLITLIQLFALMDAPTYAVVTAYK